MTDMDIENAVEITTLLKKLTDYEGDAVTIINDNPDFGGDNSCVETVRDFTYKSTHYGDSVLDCLRSAVEFHSR